MKGEKTVKIFISGSPMGRYLTTRTIEKLNGMIEKGHEIYIGNGAGIDKLVRKFFEAREYRNVVVYKYSNDRRKTTFFPVNIVKKPRNPREAWRYVTAEKLMAIRCDCAFMIWNGTHDTTLEDIGNVASRNKVAYVLYTGKTTHNGETTIHKDDIYTVDSLDAYTKLVHMFRLDKVSQRKEEN